MKARLVRLSAALVAASAMLIFSLPASAGSVEWTDPADDAKDFLLLTNTPLPSEPSLDIVKTTMSSDDKNLVWTIQVKALAEAPEMAPGSFFRFNFDYEGESFAFRAAKDPTGETLQFRVVSDQIGTNLPCDNCEVVYDLNASKVILTAPIASLTAGIAAADTACPACRGVPAPDPLPPVSKGAEFIGLDVVAQYYYVRTTPSADTSVAPDGTTFTL